MIDFAGAVAVIGGGIEAARGLLAVKALSDNTELEVQLHTVVRSLTTAEFALHDAQRDTRAMQDEIARLNEALVIRETVVLMRAAYYKTNEAGQPTGAPFCMKCWEGDKRLLHLACPAHYDKPAVCHHCKSQYDHKMASRLD